MNDRAALAVLACFMSVSVVRPQSAPVPTERLAFGAFEAQFSAGGGVVIEGEGWPRFEGTWSIAGSEVVLETSACETPGRYRFDTADSRFRFALVTDECAPRRMILDGSSWRPAGREETMPERVIALERAPAAVELPEPVAAAESWPSFRGPRAAGVAHGQRLPDRWDGPSGENIRWRLPIPGLAHSSPIVWGDRLFVTTAISSRADASFRPGLYGDGDASDDRTPHRFMVLALDKRTGEKLWERVAYEGVPIGKRHVKSTYASATPATDGRYVVAWFGSNGVYAYDVDGNFRWKLDLGHLDLGAYDVPTFEWGPASSPIIWRGIVFLQCDTQHDAFVLALDVETGETRWKAQRDELPSWSTPTVYEGPAGVELVTNAPNLIRGYEPATGAELWRLGGSSKITAPTPVFTDGLIVVASGRRPEQPIFIVRAGARGDLTLAEGRTRSDAIVWSKRRRGPYMPTPLVYENVLYVLGNNGVFDAYELESGEELYRARVPHLGSGFSASPVAADGKIYLSNEDGEIVVVKAGPSFDHVATNSMGELLMATPALSDGAMFVRSSTSLFAVGRQDEAAEGAQAAR